MFHRCNHVFGIVGVLWRSANINRPNVGNNVKDDSSDYTCITYFLSSDVQVLLSSHNLLHLSALFSVIISLVAETLSWMLDLGSFRPTVIMETGS
jgi:hypothetical protein